MKTSLRYKITLWMVWAQPVLIIIAIFMIEHTGPYRVWRWNLPFWSLLIGYILGILLLPFSRGLDKPKVLKWWLRIDFGVTILMFIPFWFTLAGCEVSYISTKRDYVIYNRGGFMSIPYIDLGVKSGLFINYLNNFQVDFWEVSDEDWGIDIKTGYYWLKGSCNNDNIVYIGSIDSTLYHSNESIINKRIDKLFHSNTKNCHRMEFIMPDDFSRITYTDSTCIEYYKADDTWYNASVEISYTPEKKLLSPDSVHIRLNDTNEELVCHKDSVPWMSPLEVRQFITDLERRVAR